MRATVLSPQCANRNAWLVTSHSPMTPVKQPNQTKINRRQKATEQRNISNFLTLIWNPYMAILPLSIADFSSLLMRAGLWNLLRKSHKIRMKFTFRPKWNGLRWWLQYLPHIPSKRTQCNIYTGNPNSTEEDTNVKAKELRMTLLQELVWVILITYKITFQLKENWK